VIPLTGDGAPIARLDDAELVTILFDRFERQATEIAELRLLTTRAQSLEEDAIQERAARERIEVESHEARARIAELEAAGASPGRWSFGRRLRHDA
jgi:hypothetical protein